jgi:tetratricopeptide (TPR) repeat protein
MLIALLKGLWRSRSPQKVLESAVRALDDGQSRRAADLLAEAVRKAPRHAECHFYAGLAQFRLGAHAEALRYFERAIVLDPDRALFRYQAAAMQLALGEAAAARALCQQALALDPLHKETHYLLASIDLPGPPYTALLGEIHRALAPRTYVEIGIASGRSLERVLPATRVVGIDPAPRIARPLPPSAQVFAMPSDEYFATRDVQSDVGGPVELAFIDGAHVFEQALRDFINIERNSTRDSTILLHDCYPLTRETAEREQRTVFWSGDVWRLVLILKKYRPELTISTVAAAPTGLCVVRGLDPASRVLAERHDAIVEEFMAIDYNVLEQGDKAALLNLVPNDPERMLALLGGTPRQATPA